MRNGLASPCLWLVGRSGPSVGKACPCLGWSLAFQAASKKGRAKRRMRSRSAAVAVLVFLLSASGAVICFQKVRQYRSDANWALARGNAEAREYAETLDSGTAEKQLLSFE